MINLKSTFNPEDLRGLTIVKCGISILENTTDDEILKSELVKLISEKTSKSGSSINGTLWGNDITPPPHKLMGHTTFIQSWIACKTSTGRGRIIRIGSKIHKNTKVIKNTYDTKEKQKARSRGIESYLKKYNGNNPIILTMAGSHGYDVKRFLKIKPGAIIYNAESNPTVFDTIKKQKLNMLNYYGDISKLVENTADQFFDMINFDTDGYVSQRSDKTLNIINKKRAGRIVCVTIQDLKRFRNHGEFADFLRKRYKSTLDYLTHGPMTNYNIIDTYVYKRNPDDPGSKSMRVIVFEVKQ